MIENQNGFTIAEAFIVLAIVVILIALMAVAMRGY